MFLVFHIVPDKLNIGSASAVQFIFGVVRVSAENEEFFCRILYISIFISGVNLPSSMELGFFSSALIQYFFE